MVESAKNNEQKPAAARAGALKSTLTVELHTLYAIRLWEGRRSQNADPETSGKRRPDIYSMPRFILRAGQINGKRTARAVLTRMCYSVGCVMRQGSSSLTRLTGQSAMTSST